MDDSVIKDRLLSLEFVHTFFLGISVREEKRFVDEHEIWCDNHFTVAIQEKGKGVALIGFQLSEETLFVEQLQGIKGVNVKCNDFGEVLLRYAEIMARKLERRIVCVLPAHRNLYWDLHEDHELYPKLYAHKNRLKRRYDASASKRGYEPPAAGYSWWHKVIRKRLTSSRWAQLQMILFNRSARERLSSVRQFEPVE
jgi:hypothetical protein